MEVATELVDRLRAVANGGPVRVVLVERAGVVGPELGDGPRPHILEALAETGVEVRLGVQVDALDAGGASLSDGTQVIPAHTVVWTAGMRASSLTEHVPAERDAIGRLRRSTSSWRSSVWGVTLWGNTAAAVA